jgi:L-asparaginase II
VSEVLAEVTRGDLVESVHHGVVVAADADGNVVAAAGDAEMLAFFRSAAKPFQAVPLVESGAADRFDFTPADMALCCSSHDGMRWQQDAVARMLAKAGVGPEVLRCGVAPPYDEEERARVTLGLVPPSPFQCDCSGKHAGMVATCVHLGYPIDSYLDPDHPLQRGILTVIASALGLDQDLIHVAPDGCSVPTFGAPLRTFATAYATLGAPDLAAKGAGREHAAALNHLRSAMAGHPEHIAGPGELDTDLMAATDGRIIAKLGAEGLLCLAAPERGLGIAISIRDGSERARGTVALTALEQLDLLRPAEAKDLRTRQDQTVTNFNGWRVGEIRPTFALDGALQTQR